MKDQNIEIIRNLIHHCCPANWGDYPKTSGFWLDAERVTGIVLPDYGYSHNQEARAEYIRRGLGRSAGRGPGTRR